eukprot:714469_1
MSQIISPINQIYKPTIQLKLVQLPTPSATFKAFLTILAWEGGHLCVDHTQNIEFKNGNTVSDMDIQGLVNYNKDDDDDDYQSSDDDDEDAKDDTNENVRIRIYCIINLIGFDFG